MQIGEWNVNPDEQTLTSNSDVVKLTPRSWEVLRYLADHAGELISTDDLAARFWRGPLTDESAVRKAVLEIRRALDDDPQAPRYIKTVRKRGYILVAQVGGSEAPAQQKAIAVLPFRNMSGDREQDFFADGISEDILNGLVRLADLKVIARTSSFVFRTDQDVRKVGELLSVTHVLEGSVRKAGNRIRLTAQLIATSDGSHVWSQQYNRELIDIFEVQDQITEAILRELRVHLRAEASKSKRLVNVGAYNATLRARHHQNHLRFDEAIRAYEQAISYDPRDADAYAALAMCHDLFVWFTRRTISEQREVVEGYIDKALSLDQNQVVARAISTNLRFYAERRYQAAINEISELLVRFPNHGTVLGGYRCMMATIGRDDLAVRLLEHAVELDPLSAQQHRVLGESLARAGHFEEAREAFERASGLGLDVWDRHYELVVEIGDIEEMWTFLPQVVEAAGKESLMTLQLKARIHYLSGEQEELQSIIHSASPMLRGPRMKIWFALLEGDYEAAADSIRQGLTQFYPMFWHLTGSVGQRRAFPEYYRSKVHLNLRREVGLDDESISKLDIRPLRLR